MTRTARRAGFTLVELLVVIALIIVLAALTAAVVQTGMLTSQKVVSAADRASGWLLIAKQRALRDGAPRGVRFLMTDAGGGFFRVTDAQYIESPEPWIPNPDSNPNGARLAFVYRLNGAGNGIEPPPRLYFFGTAADVSDFQNRVSRGDMIVLPLMGTSFQISNILPAANEFQFQGAPVSQAIRIELVTFPDLAAGHTPQALAGPPPMATMLTDKFAIQPQARPLLGEPTVQLTGNTVIDFRVAAPTTTLGVTPVAPAGQQPFFDILFAPAGSVMNTGADPGLIFLWVRDPDLTPHPRLPTDAAGYNAAGEQVLVTIYTQTGLISTHPVKPPPYADPANEPYQFARDGADSGL